MNGSMVLPFYLWFVIALAERNNEPQKEDKVPQLIEALEVNL